MRDLRRSAWIAGLLLLVPTLPEAQTLPSLDEIRMLNGTCDGSRVSVGKAGEDLSDESHRVEFRCDSLIASYHRRPGTLMLTFAAKSGGGDDFIGFAGKLKENTLEVQRVYLRQRQVPVEGACKLFLGPSKQIVGAVCGTRIVELGVARSFVIKFEASE